MSFFADFGKGISSHVKAVSFISKHHLWHYFIFPVLISAALCFFGIFFLWQFGDHWWKLIYGKIQIYLPKEDGFSSRVLGEMALAISWIFGKLAQLIISFLFLKTVRYVVLIVCSPVMASLSKKTDEILTGKKAPFIFKNFLYDVFRGISVTLRNMFLEGIILLGLFFLFLIPIIGWLTVPFSWVIGWYFLGFNMMDYTYERRRMKISQGAHFTRKHKGIAMGNGMIYSFLLWIPVLGICIAPILSTLAATLATVEAFLERK